MSQIYNPTSFFYIDRSVLPATNVPNASDIFGPLGSNKYRTTSVVRVGSGTNPKKVFAICDGTLLIQPTSGAGNEGKVNIILKPKASYNPLKIKFFIYRGVNKADLIANNALPASNTANLNQPKIIQDLWLKYAQYYPGDTPPTVFSATKIGYDPNRLSTVLLDSIFNLKTNAYILPTCTAGEYIGNFTTSLGLDIVLDYGDYKRDRQESLFNLDLNYSGKIIFEFDTNSLGSSADQIKIGRYRESIQQFVDPTAFWGSHIKYGSIKNSDNAVFKTAAEVNDNILKRLQNNSKIYFYITDERGRTYNYSRSRGLYIKLLSEPNDPSSDAYKTQDWPILMPDFTFPGSDNVLRFKLNFDIGDHIDFTDMRASIDVFSPGASNDLRSFEFKYKDIQAGSGDLPPMLLECNQTSGKSCANFFFINCNTVMVDPAPRNPPAGGVVKSNDYYNQMWPVDFNSTFEIPSGKDVSYSVNYDQGRMVNLASISGMSACIENRMVFDYAGTAGVARKLFLGVVKRTTKNGVGSDKLNVTDLTSSVSGKLAYSSYLDMAYGKAGDFDLYRGQAQDGADVIRTLALTNKSDIDLKNSFYHLGITKAQHDLLLALIPATGVDNVFFYLDPIVATAGSDFSKFKLGISFEDLTDPSVLLTANPTTPINIYTIDGYYFFSKDYSDVQDLSIPFAKSEVSFRPGASWTGEFGFDWVRNGDSSATGDGSGHSGSRDRTFKTNVGRYYNTSVTPHKKEDLKEDESNSADVHFQAEASEYLRLLRTYPLYPKTSGGIYSGSWLSLYPSLKKDNTPTLFPKHTFSSNRKFRCLTEASLELKVLITQSPTNLRLRYKKALFSIIPKNSHDAVLVQPPTSTIYDEIEIIDKTTNSTARTIPILIKALQEFSSAENILVIATEGSDQRVAGCLSVIPNEKQCRKEIQLAFINCETNINSPNSNVFGLRPNRNDHLVLLDSYVKAFNQALIDVNAFSISDEDLRNLNPTFFNQFKTPLPVQAPVNYLGRVSHDFLKQQTINPAVVFPNHLSFFILGDNSLLAIDTTNNANTPKTLLDGDTQDIGTPCVIIYQTGTPGASNNQDLTTIAHEGGHALALYHSFSNDSPFTFQKYITDNVMDYTGNSINPSVVRVCFYKFQWDILTNYNSVVLKTEV